MPSTDSASTTTAPTETAEYGARTRLGITVYGCDHDEAVVFRRMMRPAGATLTLTGAAVSEANAELASGNRCISVGHKTPITNATLRALSRSGIAYISTRSIGYDHIDVAYARSVGICVENVAYSPGSVADYTLMLMLMAIRQAGSIFRRADVHDYRLNETRGLELADLTIGIVGTGRIGAAVIDRLRGFGCRIVAYDQRPAPRGLVERLSLDELLRQSDIVSLHAPLTATTFHLLDDALIGRMKPHATVVNTARGSLIDTEALIRALEAGRIGGAALDVLEGEVDVFYTDRSDRPIESAQLLRLRALPNVIISPHTAFYTERALLDTVENTLANCLRFERDHRA